MDFNHSLVYPYARWISRLVTIFFLRILKALLHCLVENGHLVVQGGEGNLSTQSCLCRLAARLPVSSITFTPTCRSTWAPSSAAWGFVLEGSQVWGLSPMSSFHFSGFLRQLQLPHLLSSPEILLFSSLILAAHVLFSPSAAILSEVAGGYLIHQVLLNSHDVD